ncbi:MAG: hypothetical protein IIY87_02425 [Bacteroidales bacterium]|nr:hypothetical protein [Bacteroidales bacterium]
MKTISRLLMTALLVFAMAACGEKENNISIEPDVDGGTVTPTNPIKVGRIGNGPITINGETTNDVYGVDFNNDGTLEFRIGGDYPYYYIAYDYMSQCNIVNIAEQWDYIQPLKFGDTICDYSRFEGQGDASFSDPESLPTEFYVGCRVAIDNKIHYGWIKVEKTGDNLNWKECAYNSNPSKGIKAGQK